MEKKLTKRNWIKFICIFLPLISIIAAYSYINLNGFKIAQMLEEYRDYKWEIVIRGYTQEKQPYEKRYIGNIGQKDTVIKTIRNSTFRRIYNYKENENDIPFFELSIVLSVSFRPRTRDDGGCLRGRRVHREHRALRWSAPFSSL